MGLTGEMMATFRATNAKKWLWGRFDRVLPAWSWEMQVERELPAKIGQCNENLAGRNFDFRAKFSWENFLCSWATSSQEDLALGSKLWPAKFSLHGLSYFFLSWNKGQLWAAVTWSYLVVSIKTDLRWKSIPLLECLPSSDFSSSTSSSLAWMSERTSGHSLSCSLETLDGPF